MKKLVYLLLISVLAFSCIDKSNINELQLDNSNLEEYLSKLNAMQKSFDGYSDPLELCFDVKALYLEDSSTKSSYEIDSYDNDEFMNFINNFDVNDGDFDYKSLFENQAFSIKNNNSKIKYIEEYIYNITLFILRENIIAAQKNIEEIPYIGNFSINDNILYQIIEDIALSDHEKKIFMSNIIILNSFASISIGEFEKISVTRQYYGICERDRDNHLANLRAEKIATAALGIIVGPIGWITATYEALTDGMSEYYAKKQAQIMKWYDTCVKNRGY